MFGLRHAVDADHITAIDNVVRKLIQEGRRSETVGLWFSLGHSTVVALASLAVAASSKRVEAWFGVAQRLGGVTGALVSASFLFGIAAANLLVLRDLWPRFVQARQGLSRYEEAPLDALPGPGLLTRLARPLFRVIKRSWQMYPLGFLFGLGFDTATEIGVLGLSAAQAARGMTIWHVMAFPALFTAGMALVDTADSVLMAHAYGWAFINPLRKLWYNLTITLASVLAAVLIGAVEVLGLVGNQLSLVGPVWTCIARLDTSLGYLGFAVISVFVLCWVVSLTAYRLQGHHRS
jgi:high-affinity nickel-transport protein